MNLRLFMFERNGCITHQTFNWVFAVLLLLGMRGDVHAHEGHAALPTKGATVVGDQLLLSAGARKAIGLKTAKVTLADMRRMITAKARVELPWQQQSMVTTLVPGRIERVLIRPGDSVGLGQELARIESLEMESLQRAMLQADAQLKLAKELALRRSMLAEQGVIPGKLVLEAETKVKKKNAKLEIAVCKLRALGLNQSVLNQIRSSRKPLSTVSITSPIGGIVAEADVRVGQVVKTTEHLFHIVDLSRIWVVGQILESDLSDVRVGQPVSVRFPSFSNRIFDGKLDHLHLKMDVQKRTRSVVVVLENSARLLRPGMFGQMEIEVVFSEETITCPTDGLIESGGNTYVLLRRGDGKYLRRPIRIGIRNHDRVEVLKGLFPGDQIVVTGNHVLFSLFGDDQSKTNETTAGKNPQRVATERRLVLTRKGKRRGGTLVLQGTVELPTNRKVFASSRIEGRIARILVEHSQPVHAGDVLAEVESLELRNVQGDLLDVHSQLIWTNERKSRLESLTRQNLTSKKELWQLQTDSQVLEITVSSLRHKLTMIGVSEKEIQRIMQTDLSAADCNVTLVRRVPIRAPMDGFVTDFDIVPGQVVRAQSALFEVQNPATLWVKGYVFQRDAMRLHKGQAAKVTFPAHPTLSISGKVVRMSPVLSSSERVLPVWIEVENLERRLIEGMLARVEIETTSGDIVLAPVSKNTER